MHAFSDDALPATALHVAILGDSLAFGVGATRPEFGMAHRLYAHVRAERPGSTYINYAVPHSTMGDVLRMQVPQLHGSNAHLVLLIAGANDLRTTAHPFTILRRFRHLLDAVHATVPNAHLIAAGMPDVAQTIGVPALMKPLIARLCGTLSEGMRRVVSEYGDEFIDLFSFTNRPLRSDFTYLCGDGYHPCDGGYEELAARSISAVERVLSRYSSSTCSSRSASISS